MKPARIVIIGGGFAGVKCAETLCRRLPQYYFEVVLFNQENHMVFHPLLAEVVGSSLDPQAVVAPLRQMLPEVQCRTETVQNIDLATSEIIYESHDGHTRRLPYDHVVITCGRVANLGSVPGMADHALPLKTIGDAIQLRAHVIAQLEKAEVCEDAERRRWYLSFIIVGGGFSGVEVAGEINDFVRDTYRYYHSIDPEEISVTVVHSGGQILPEIGEGLRDFALRKMEAAGITVILNSRVAMATPEGVGITDGPLIRGATIVCTAGTTVAPMVRALEAAKTKDRLATEADMRLVGYPNAWALGDCAWIINAYNGQPSPPTGQFAERQGRQVADNILRLLARQPTRPFYFKPLGQLCSIGGHTAVADLFGWHLSGFWAWFIWRGIYLLKMPSWARRMRVGFDWAWQLIFVRDLSSLKPDLTDRISQAHFHAGDYVFKQGDPATNFYVIRSGEAEVVRANGEAGTEEILAVLGSGSFFGELALSSNRPHRAGIRARTPLEVVVMGREVFTQISQSLTPLRELLVETINRRNADLWHQRPGIYEILKRTPLKHFVEPAPQPLFHPDQSFAELIEAFDQKRLEFGYVVQETGNLEGLVTRTDLFRALNSGAKPTTPVSEFMTKQPVTVALDDSSLVAAATLRDRRLKWIPVVAAKDSPRVVGCIKAHIMLARVMKAMALGNVPEAEKAVEVAKAE